MNRLIGTEAGWKSFFSALNLKRLHRHAYMEVHYLSVIRALGTLNNV